MDFFQISSKEVKGGALEIYPDFVVGRSKDLMVQGGKFYAVWDPETNLWSTDEYDVQRLVDSELREHAEKHGISNVKYMRSFGSNAWNQFRKFMSQVSNNSEQLDSNLTFANTDVKKNDYVSRRLPYPLAAGDHSAWDELIGTLYSPDEKAKIEWAIGSVVAGDSKKIQKFIVLYGPPGHGKGTVLDIVLKLFDGYATTFEAKALVGNNNTFATEMFKGNPLVAVQHDGDLSRIEDNTKLNSIISHETMTMNEKYKSGYSAKVNAFLFMGTNSPVKISDAKSGLLRRLIDVQPTGNLVPTNHYHVLMSKVDFELGAIAHHCLETYREMGKNYYSTYRPLEMMFQTDIFFNFIEANWDIFNEQDGTTLKQAYALYKTFCEDTGIPKPLAQYKVREELRNYFKEFKDRSTLEDGTMVRSYYSGFTAHPFKAPVKNDATVFSLVMDDTTSIIDLELGDQPAQGSKLDEFGKDIPAQRWSLVKTTLSEIDTSKLHYVKIPDQRIVIDFDLKDKKGKKSLEKNLEAASEWPATYAEISQGGSGVHLHYDYEGDVTQLAHVYSEGIEVKTLLGDASLRRRLSKCNNVPVATINSGLPFKEKKKMLDSSTIQSEKSLRALIARNLRKEIHPGTKSSIDFINHILEQAYLSGMTYDVSDLKGTIVAFANNSTNQPLPSLKIVQGMKWKSDGSACKAEEPAPSGAIQPAQEPLKDDRLVIFDCEVYPNLFVICWKYEGDADKVRMINPSPQEVEKLFQLPLVGFNCRRYDNHILYARYMGYNNEQLYKLSKKIMDKIVGAMFGAAYDLSHADIYDFSSEKKSLKRWGIDLGLTHMEMDIPWDEPVPDDKIEKVVEYCCNDVDLTEAVLNHRRQDYVGRQILAELSGLKVNDTNPKHTAKIIFGDDRNPQRSFVYTDLGRDFPGYQYDRGKSYYREEVTGEGGYIYAEPGMYENVALLDVASMHPNSIIQLNLFGEYTPNFKALLDARMAIKSRDYESAKRMLGGKLRPFVEDIERMEDPEKEKAAQVQLSDALKIAINTVYGLTSAKFDNPFRDVRNVDNIVAKRGALFMVDLKHAVQEQGFTVAHIKTDSIKIPNATPEIIDFVKQYGEKYGYTFEHEETYDKFCLVNDAVYIARVDEPTLSGVEEHWTAVGAQFQHPYVFKTLFTGEPIKYNDLCETKQVQQGVMYLDFDIVKPMAAVNTPSIMHFVGRTGRFVPVKEGEGGGILYRVKNDKDGTPKTYSVNGTKGYLWLEAEVLHNIIKGHMVKMDEAIDMSYFERLADEAKMTIEKFGNFEEFVS